MQERATARRAGAGATRVRREWVARARCARARDVRSVVGCARAIDVRVRAMCVQWWVVRVLTNFIRRRMSFGDKKFIINAGDILADSMACMDVKDDDMSMGSSNAETELDLLRAQIRHLQGQNNVMAMATTTLTQQLAETSAAVSLEQQKHNRIISNPVFVSAISAMLGPDLDIDTLWWMVQWGNEYLAKFKRDGSFARKKTHDDYKKWTAHTKQKQMASFTASLRSAAGDDSLNQSQND